MENGTVTGTVAIKGNDLILGMKKRDRRTADEVMHDHYNEVLQALTFEQKVELIKSLKESVNIEVANRSRLAEQALAITNGI